MVAGESSSLSGEGDVGTWKTSGEKRDSSSLLSHVSDVVVESDAGEVVLEESSSVLDALAEEGVLESGTSESEVKATGS